MYVSEHGSSGACSACNKKTISVKTDDENFAMLFKALIRYHFSEWEYNRHLGGDNLECLFYQENPILNFYPETDLAVFEQVILSIIEGRAYEDYEKGVSLFAGYTEDGIQAGILMALKKEESGILRKISRGLESNNYYDYEDELLSIMKPFSEKIKKTIIEGMTLYRARSGVKQEKSSIQTGYEAEKHYQPFCDGDIAAPPTRLAKGGRINRDGVSFFYGATNFETAISEIRPHPGDKVSVGKFTTNKEITLADFSENKLIHYFQSDKSLDEEFVFLNSVNIYLNRLVTPSAKSHYSITQLIADILRRLGFDGVTFNSTVGDGNNVAIFYPQHVSYDESYRQVVNVCSLSYEFEDTPLIDEDGVYTEYL
jgi:hypothetical protein